MIQDKIPLAVDGDVRDGRNGLVGRRLFALLLYSISIVAIFVVSIVDFAITGAYTWSLVPVSAILFAMLCALPLFFARRHVFDAMLLSASVFVIPFLWVLCTILGDVWFVPLGLTAAAVGIVTAWAVRAVYATRLNGWNMCAATAIILALSVVVTMFALEHLLGFGGLDVWDIGVVAALVVVALVSFVGGRLSRRGTPFLG